MLHGQLVSLRARRLEDIPILQDELHDDVPTRSRADGRPWRPISPGSNASPYAVREPDEEVAAFSVVELASQDLVGEASLWKVDTHNRSAHVGLAFRPAMRRRGYGADVVQRALPLRIRDARPAPAATGNADRQPRHDPHR